MGQSLAPLLLLGMNAHIGDCRRSVELVGRCYLDDDICVVVQLFALNASRDTIPKIVHGESYMVKFAT